MDALIIVDVQNDFLPGGTLPVPRGDEVVPAINRLLPRFALLVATQDWHPPNHRSFASQHPGRSVGDVIDLNGLPQVLWPDHCIQDTPGAAFAPRLETSRIERVFQKGVDPGIDSYSGFFDNAGRRDTGLGAFLSERGVTRVCVVGLATDYCVKATALDARRLGYDATVVLEAVRGVELNPGDCDRAVREMRAAGVVVA